MNHLRNVIISAGIRKKRMRRAWSNPGDLDASSFCLILFHDNLQRPSFNDLHPVLLVLRRRRYFFFFSQRAISRGLTVQPRPFFTPTKKKEEKKKRNSSSFCRAFPSVPPARDLPWRFAMQLGLKQGHGKREWRSKKKTR